MWSRLSVSRRRVPLCKRICSVVFGFLSSITGRSAGTSAPWITASAATEDDLVHTNVNSHRYQYQHEEHSVCEPHWR